MNRIILSVPVIAVAALSLAACGPKSGSYLRGGSVALSGSHGCCIRRCHCREGCTEHMPP